MQQAYWIIVTFIALAILMLVLHRFSSPAPYPTDTLPALFLNTQAHCQLVGTGCVAIQEEKVLRLRLLKAAQPLEPFTLELFASQPVVNPMVEFIMVDMDMGVHRYRFLPQKEGGWVAKVILPICTTGRIDWLVTVSADFQGRRWQAEFPLLLEK